MITSMTGFASTTAVIAVDTTKTNVSLSLKSLNSRFFEASCKLPYLLSSMETSFIKLFKTRLLRGHIYFTIHLQESQILKGNVEPSLPLVQGYLAAIEKIKKQFPTIQGSLSVDNLLRIPDMFSMPEQSINESVEKQLLEITHNLINSLLEAQQKEGAVLAADLTERIRRLSLEIEEIHKESTALIEQQKIKVQTAVQEIAQMANEDQIAEMRKNALYAVLDKMDIHEEIVRFKSHLKNFNDQLQSPAHEKGKQLDFILQELAREINTIAAKCSDASIGKRAINTKVELEKAREQVQNIV